MPLTGKQRHHLRALAHHLDPIVQVGHEGLTEAVIAQIDEALAAHELIKVRIASESPVDREEAAARIAEGARAEVAQIIGRVVVVYRRRPKKAKVAVPAGGASDASRGKRGKQGSKGRPPRARVRARKKKVEKRKKAV
jgi:RNA-binding protein